MNRLFEHVSMVQESPPELAVAYCCEICEDPVYAARQDRHGRLCCAECEEIGEAICAYVHTERLAVVRARAVLAREGVRKYPGVPEMSEEERRLGRRGERYGMAFALRYGLPREEEPHA